MALAVLCRRIGVSLDCRLQSARSVPHSAAQKLFSLEVPFVFSPPLIVATRYLQADVTQTPNILEAYAGQPNW